MRILSLFFYFLKLFVNNLESRLGSARIWGTRNEKKKNSTIRIENKE